MRQEAVQEEGHDEAEEGNGEADWVDVVLDDRLHVDLKCGQSAIRRVKPLV